MTSAARSFVIRISAFVILAATLGWLGYRLTRPATLTAPPLASAATPKVDTPTKVSTDATAIFQRAFWKHPTAEDKILHAERREWADTDGLKKWQWFLVVEPSPSLLKRLREENVFRLKPAAKAQGVSDAPTWFAFRPEDIETLQSSFGNLRLFFHKTKPLLYATDAGAGFHSGAPESARPAPTETASSGRLPITAPPNPTPEP